MKLLNFSIALLLALLPLHSSANETDSLFHNKNRVIDCREHRSREGWARIIPTHCKLQFAGSMGLFSAGIGWDYGKKARWETDLLLGYVPKYNSDKSHYTFTLKQNYIPWRVPLTRGLSLDPLYTGAYLNTIFGDEFWSSQPDRYPSGYYWFSTRFRAHIFLGVRASWHPRSAESAIKDVTLFFEINTCDLYIVRKIGNDFIKAKDIVGFSAGLKLQLF